jgi:hypothetical protein
LSLRSNPGLQLANAFGVICFLFQTASLPKNSNAFPEDETPAGTMPV